MNNEWAFYSPCPHDTLCWARTNKPTTKSTGHEATSRTECSYNSAYRRQAFIALSKERFAVAIGVSCDSQNSQSGEH